MPISAMPEHLNSQEEIDAAFPDDSQYGTDNLFGRIYKWYQKKTKTWFAFGYRCTEWWARWRKYPIVVFAIKGNGYWRCETEHAELSVPEPNVLLFRKIDSGYLSRIQYYTRWHFSIQWPLLVTIHFYPKAADVPRPNEPRPDSDGKPWFAYWNHFDADLVYWMLTSGYLGRNWK